ncbi:MAG TPA: hypothetical protein PLP19_11665 [bacterium]|nr:hypothetical protein [bacterium]HPN44138.1 hypothetical protein [bacterium]
MDQQIKNHIENLKSNDDKIRMDALQNVLKITEQPVDWIYEVWDDMFLLLTDKNSFKRSIAFMVICNLAKSDVENRLPRFLEQLLSHTKDEKFITSRQCLLNVWKIALVNQQLYDLIISHLIKRYRECNTEDHYNLLRQDSIQSLVNIYNTNKDERLNKIIRELIVQEHEDKYKKKYAALLEYK